MSVNLKTAMNPETLNIADGIEDTILETIGSDLKKGYLADCVSREAWITENETWMKLATQFRESKSFPWPNAANIKYPLVTTAAMQFAARAYPNLVPNKKPVKTIIIGKEEEQVNEVSARIADHMNFQIMHEMDDWEEDMDKLCLILPISGTVFKKTYYDPVTERNVSELVLAKDLVVNYWSKSIDKAPRVSHVLEIPVNQVQTRVRKGIFRDTDYGETRIEATNTANVNTTRQEAPAEADYTTPYTFIECHTRYDLDDDGYAEPYVITFELNTGTVARIIPRFYQELVEYGQDDQADTVISIDPINYFTKFGFIPNPDGGFYDMGFGLLLGPLNETINSSINQLLDAGTLSTLQAGFLGKGVRIRGGEYKMGPNEWKVVNANVDDLRKHIFPLPVKEPSNVLFQLLGTLIQAGKELSSVADIMVGKMPGQNTPATTTMETVKQGMAVFTAIYKRVYRSLDQEYKKLYNLNKLFMDDEITHPVDLAKEVYATSYLTVIPTADPEAASDADRMQKAELVMGLAAQGMVNPQVAVKRVLDAARIEGQEELLNMPPPQPSPEEKKAELEGQIKTQDAQLKAGLAQQKGELEKQKLALEERRQEMVMEFDAREHEQEMRQAEQKHQLDMIIEGQKAEMEAAVKEALSEVGIRTQIDKAEVDKQLKRDKAAAQSTQTKE